MQKQAREAKKLFCQVFFQEIQGVSTSNFPRKEYPLNESEEEKSQFFWPYVRPLMEKFETEVGRQTKKEYNAILEDMGPFSKNSWGSPRSLCENFDNISFMPENEGHDDDGLACRWSSLASVNRRDDGGPQCICSKVGKEGTTEKGRRKRSIFERNHEHAKAYYVIRI